MVFNVYYLLMSNPVLLNWLNQRLCFIFTVADLPNHNYSIGLGTRIPFRLNHQANRSFSKHLLGTNLS